MQHYSRDDNKGQAISTLREVSKKSHDSSKRQWYNGRMESDDARARFERLVAEAVRALPDFFLEKLNNVEIVVEDWPDAATLREAKVRRPSDLLGFYHGVPQTRRTHAYTLVLPDKISIYRFPIEMRARDVQHLRSLILHVVKHEIAHHFGIDDTRLHELGL